LDNECRSSEPPASIGPKPNCETVRPSGKFEVRMGRKVATPSRQKQINNNNNNNNNYYYD
jgi:hypothetical protein